MISRNSGFNKFENSDRGLNKILDLADRITLKQLRALKVVHEQKTISAAADVLGLTAPAVHNQLKMLEETVEAKLISREQGKGNTLTPQGKVLLLAYSEMSSSLARAMATVESINGGDCGNLTLGVVSTGKYFAPKIVALLREAMPEVTVSLRIGNRTETIARLERGEVDLCIMGRPPRVPLCSAQTLADHPHVLVASPDHHLAKRRLVGSGELLTERFVLREEGSGTRIMASRFLDEIGKGQIFETFEMNSNETIKQAVIAGLGIAVLSAHTISHELETGRLVTLDVSGFPLVRHWFIVTPANVIETAITTRVREWLLTNKDAFIPQVEL